MYKVAWTDLALNQLKTLGSMAKRIKSKVETYLIKDPKNLGKPLVGERKGNYRYQVGKNWRVIYKIEKNQMIILVLEVGHRSKIYE